jgi:hypothetical protein
MAPFFGRQAERFRQFRREINSANIGWLLGALFAASIGWLVAQGYLIAL